MYADIIVDISHEKLDRSFQYRIPERLQSGLKIGMRVRIPFGAGDRLITGYVVGITEDAAYDPEKQKEILSVEPGSTSIESKLISLAGWLREQYGCTMNQALKTVLPVRTRVRQKQRRVVRLAVSRRQAEEYLNEARRKHYSARARLLEALILAPEGRLDGSAAAKELKITSSVLDPLVKAGVIAVDTDRVVRGIFSGGKPAGEVYRPEPDPQQQRVIDGIREEAAGKKRPCLLHGVTGSGKTLVYMELIRGILEEGKQAIVLIPEIALTYQTVRRFYEYFGGSVAVLHSRLSQGERYDQMELAREGKLQVMVGPRSALFTPFPDLGMIIVDEEQEHSYKSEIMPRYHARDVAIRRGEMEGAQVILGSATPSVDSYYRAKRGEYALFVMDERHGAVSLPRVEVVDLRQELKEGSRSIISRRLGQAIGERLARREQVMLFLNRRGYAGFVSCRSCGSVAKCPHCDVSLSLHSHGRLVCHYCGYERPAFEICPVCGSPYIGGFRAGTQKIEQLLHRQFPDSRVLRMDFDTTRQKAGHAQILEAFARNEADILVGTQMIVKGHDFPRVTLVGVLAADLSLNDSDFRSGERTFQLLTQAVGRAGRGDLPGEAIIQTYQPEHYSIRLAVTQDYETFFQEEMAFRSLMGYPPSACMMAVLGGCADEQLLDRGMSYLRDFIGMLDKKGNLQIIGPAPESIGKVQDVYRRVIYIRHKNRTTLTALCGRLEEYIRLNSGFRNITIQFDFSV